MSKVWSMIVYFRFTVFQRVRPSSKPIIALWQKIQLGQIKLRGRDGCESGWRLVRQTLKWPVWASSARFCFGQNRSSLLSIITKHSRIAHHHIEPTHWRFAQSSLWNVYSNNQTHGVIPIDLYFPQARHQSTLTAMFAMRVMVAAVIKPHFRDQRLACWSASGQWLIINWLIVFLQSTPLIR